MRINGTHGFEPHQLPEATPSQGKRPTPTGKPGAEGKAPSPAADPIPAVYLRKAEAVEDVDVQAVAEARRLLEAGRLETPDAARRAAEAIIDRGV